MNFKLNACALNMVALCKKTAVAEPLMKISLVCSLARMALASNWVTYGAFILVGVVIINCALMFVVMVAALFKPASCYSLVKSV